MLNSAKLSMFNNKLNNIVLKPYDTKGTAFGAVDAMHEAVRDGVGIVVGPLFTQSTKAILDIANINNIIVLSFSDNQNLLSEKYPNVYLMGLTPEQEIYRMISYLIDYQNFYGFSAMFANDVYGSTASKMFKEIIAKKDAKIVKTEFYSKNDKNLQKKVDNLLATNTFKDEVYQKYEEEKALAKAEGITGEVEFTYTDEDKIFADALLLDELVADLDLVDRFDGQWLLVKCGVAVLHGVDVARSEAVDVDIAVHPQALELDAATAGNLLGTLVLNLDGEEFGVFFLEHTLEYEFGEVGNLLLAAQDVENL